MYRTPSWNVGDGIGNWLDPPVCQRNAPLRGSYASTRSLELTISSGPEATSTTNGVVYDMRPRPRSVFHFSLPVRLSTASRYDAGPWSHRRISRSWYNVGELPWPPLMSYD